MSSLAYNLTRKIEWMGRRIRKIDDAAEIKNWASAMREINCLLKEVEIKEYKDNWRPWIMREKRGTNVGRNNQMAGSKPNVWNQKAETVPQVGLEESKKKKRRKLPPRVEVDGDDVHMLDPKAAVMKMLNEKRKKDDGKEQLEKNLPEGELSFS